MKLRARLASCKTSAQLWWAFARTLTWRQVGAWYWRQLPHLKLPTVLLVVVAIAHYTGDIIGSTFVGREIPAATAWASVLRAFEATVLWLTVWYLVPWRPLATRYGAALVCLWGVWESSQIAIARLQYPMDRPPPDPNLYAGMSDLVTGWPIYMMTLLVVLLVVALRLNAGRRRDDAT